MYHNAEPNLDSCVTFLNQALIRVSQHWSKHWLVSHNTDPNLDWCVTKLSQALIRVSQHWTKPWFVCHNTEPNHDTCVTSLYQVWTRVSRHWTKPLITTFITTFASLNLCNISLNQTLPRVLQHWTRPSLVCHSTEPSIDYCVTILNQALNLRSNQIVIIQKAGALSPKMDQPFH